MRARCRRRARRRGCARSSAVYSAPSSRGSARPGADGRGVATVRRCVIGAFVVRQGVDVRAGIEQIRCSQAAQAVYLELIERCSESDRAVVRGYRRRRVAWRRRSACRRGGDGDRSGTMEARPFAGVPLFGSGATPAAWQFAPFVTRYHDPPKPGCVRRCAPSMKRESVET